MDARAMEEPRDIIDGLNNCHVSFVVPRQDIVHLLAPRAQQLAAVPSETSSAGDAASTALNRDPDAAAHVVRDILRDLDELDAPELETLRFRKCATKTASDSASGHTATLGLFDAMIFDRVANVQRHEIVKIPLKMKRIRLGPKDGEMARRPAVATSKHTPDGPEGLEAPSPKRQRKSSYLQADELQSRFTADLLSVMQEIGLTDEAGDHSAAGVWVQDADAFNSVLTVSVLDRIHECITGIRGSQAAIQELDISILMRIQELCHNSLTRFAGSNFAQELNSDSGPFPPFEPFENACRAATIMMSLFLFRREEKQLYLDRYLWAVVEFAAAFLEDVVLPFTRSGIKPDHSEWKSNFKKAQNSVNTVLSLVDQYVSGNNLEEDLITRLEYLASSVIFSEANTRDKSSAVDAVAFENLRMTSCNLICSIFCSREDQRQFIINEILANMDKLPVHRAAARHCKLSRGINVQLVSILLVRLVQTFGLSDFGIADDRIWKLLDLNSTELRKSEKTELALVQEQIIASTSDAAKKVSSVCNEIVFSLLDKISRNLDTSTKQVFEILIEDLLNIVAFPEWAGAETLLASFMRNLIHIFESSTYSAQTQSFALEVIGTIGRRILQLKQQRECIDFSHSMSILDFKNLTKDYTQCLLYLQLHEDSAFEDSNNGFNFFALKVMSNINEVLFQWKPHAEVAVPKMFGACSKFQKYLVSAVRLSSVPTDHGHAIASDLDGSAIASYDRVLLTQELLHLYDTFLNLILKTLDHNKIKSRTKAIRNLSSLISGEPTILSLSIVSSTITARMNDPSAQVRDAVIELIGQFFDVKPDLINEYYQILCARMADTSIAVRKRAIKLCKAAYHITNQDHIKATIAERLLHRLEDEEDTVVDMTRDALLEIWLPHFTTDVAQPSTSTMSRITIILEVLSRNEKNWEHFKGFLTDHVLLISDHAIFTEAMRSLKDIIDEALDFVIESADNTALQARVELAMGLLSIISKAHGSLISQDQLVCLKPYLTDESSTGNNICYYSLSIFRSALPEATVLKPSFLKDCQMSLLKRLTRFNTKELSEAVPCVWMLSKLRNDTSRIASAAISCLKLTRPYLEPANRGELTDSDSKVLRILYLLGNFGKYCDFNPERQAFISSGFSLNETESPIHLFVKYLFCFTNDNLNRAIKRAAVRNLIYVSSSHAKFFMTDGLLSILDREFTKSETDIKGVIIQEFIDFLEQEDAFNLRKTGKGNTYNSKASSLNVSVFHGTSHNFVTDGICANLVQRYMEPILKLALDEKHHAVSMLATKYLQLVMKLGYANPKLCVPTIIALESSPMSALRSKALRMHTDLYAKHESLIETSYSEGIQLAFKYRKNASLEYMRENFFLRSFFQVLGDSRTSRRKFLLVLVKSFQMDVAEAEVAKIQEFKQYLIYIINNLLCVPLTTLDEAYLLCSAMDRVVSAGTLKLSLSVSSYMEHDVQDEETWHKAAMTAQVFAALVRYRTYLFVVYSLNEDRARDYRPHKPERDLKAAPKVVKEHTLKLDDLAQLHKEDYQAVAVNFVEQMGES